MADNPAIRQSTAVAIDGRGVLIEGPPGSGKSSLALALIDRGATLIGDDGVSLRARSGSLMASPPPNTAGLLEVRNLGLIEFPATQAAVALLLRLDPEAPRFIEHAETTEIEGVVIPSLAFNCAIPGAAIRVEIALTRYGE